MIADYTPSVEELAQLMPARAAGRFTGGTDAPAFPDENRVQAVIEDAVGLLAPTLGGDDLDERFYVGAKTLIKFQAALILEPAAWSEQARPDKNAWEQWKLQFDEWLTSLKEAIVRFRDEPEGDEGPGSSQMPVGVFPRCPSPTGTYDNTRYAYGEDREHPQLVSDYELP